MRRSILAVHCISLAVALITTSVPASLRAAEPPAPTSTQPATPPVADAKQSFDAGLAKYEAGDYAGAIVAWTVARARMREDPQARAAYHVLGLDLAQAHVRAYRLDHDHSHFDAAQPLLDDYVAWVDRPEHTMDEAEREDRPRALEMLAYIADERAARGEPAAVPAPIVQPSTAVARPVVRIDAGAHDRQRRRARALIASGSISLGLGVASAIAAGALTPRGRSNEREFEALQQQIGGEQPTTEQAARLDDIELRGKRTNAAVIGCAVGAVLFATMGVGLLAGGLVVRKRTLRATPTVGAGYAGASLSMRF